MDGTAQWYFTHETTADKLWYQIFFSLCKKFGVSWAHADPAQKSFIEELTRVNCEKMAKREALPKSVRGSFDDLTSA